MIGNGTPPRVIDYQGYDFMTTDAGVNPLIASYIGAPYQVRGVDPAEYARAAMDYYGASSDALTSSVVSPMAAGVVGSWWDSAKVGVSGIALGLLIAALGVAYILWGRD